MAAHKAGSGTRLADGPAYDRGVTRRRALKLAACGTATLLYGASCGRPPVAGDEAVTSSDGVPTETPPATASPAPATRQPSTPTPPVISTSTPTAIPISTAAPAAPETTPLPAAAQPSLEARIGQMLLIGFPGLEVTPDHPTARDIRDRHLGGVILFDYDVRSGTNVRNIQSREQVTALVAALQSLAPTPLLISIDQEGGRVARLKEAYGFPPTLSAHELGASGDLALTYGQAAEMAALLASLGVNLNLAPVVDLNLNPDNPIIGGIERSFGADPALVTAHAVEFIKAHRAHGVACTLKHFPGHGSSTGDTHYGVVDVTATWSQAELEPYAAIIEAGLADAIMTAHVFNARLDPHFPATLSRPTITGLLREQLGYDGVIICDDIQMGAIRAQFNYEEAIRYTIEAGVDIITIANNSIWEERVVERTVAIIRGLVEQGIIAEARIDESFRRIQQLKVGPQTAATAPS